MSDSTWPPPAAGDRGKAATRPENPWAQSGAAHRAADETARTPITVSRWTWLAVLFLGFGLFEVVHQALVSTNNPNLVPALILLGATVVPASFVTFIYGLRLDFDVSAGTLMIVAFLGGVVGVVTASLLEYQTLQHLGTLPAIAIAVVEESAKLLAPLAVLLLTRHRRSANGLLVGVACGAGFAVMETMGYSAVTLIQSHENLASVHSLLLQRGLFSPATHMAWTGITAAALWFAANQRWRPAAVALLAGVFAAAVGLHAAWDTAHSAPEYLLVAAFSLSLLTMTAHRLALTQPHGLPARDDPQGLNRR